jgi:putative ABC transport system permease protein
MMTALAVRVYRLLVAAARHEAADLRSPHAETTFRQVCEASASRGPSMMLVTVGRELLVVAAVVVAARVKSGFGGRGFSGWPSGVLSPGAFRASGRALLHTHRGFLTMATFVLGVSVGVNLAVYTVVNAIWVRPLAFLEPNQVVTFPSSTFTTLETSRLSAFSNGVAAQVETSGWSAGLIPKLIVPGIGRPLETLGVTSDYFSLAGVAIKGRGFNAADDRDGAEPVAVLSDQLWASAFGRRTDVIGTVIGSEPARLRVVGVAPPGFRGLRRGERTDLWISTALVRQLAPPDWEDDPLPLVVFARLAPTQGLAEARQAFDDAMPERDRRFFDANPTAVRPTLVPVTEVFGTPATRSIIVSEHDAVMVVAALAALVLVGGCATIAALILVHYERRRVEFALKRSLGASRAWLVAELLRDVGVVAACGSLAGLAVAWTGLRVLPGLSLPGGIDLARLELTIDWRVAAVAIGVTLTTLIVAALVPMVRATSARLGGELGAGMSGTSLASQRIRQGLLAVQVASTIVVLVSAGLFVRTVLLGFSTAPGFDVDQTVFVSVQEKSPYLDISSGTDPRAISAERTVRQMRAIAALPGVEEVASGVPPIGPAGRFMFTQLRVGDQDHNVEGTQLVGSSNVLSALGVPLLAGRALTEADGAVRPYPAVISRSLAVRLWPDKDPLGQPLRVPTSRLGPFVVVGVAGDMAAGSLKAPGDGVIVTAQPHLNGVESYFIVRTKRPVGVAVEVKRSLVAQVVRVQTGRELVADDLGRQRLGAWFFSGFGLAALLLGTGGAFGLVAYLAESRRREFGVRLALGAGIGHLIGQGMWAALGPVVVGVVSGLVVAALVSRLFASLLTGIGTLDVTTYGLVAVVTLTSAAVAALLASWRLRDTSAADALRAV